MTITLELPEDVEAQLTQAAGNGDPRHIALAALKAGLSTLAAPPDVPEGSDAERAAIQEGLNDLQAGRVRPEAEAMVDLRQRYRLPTPATRP